MNNYTIRMATPDDAQALLDIYEYYVKETAITFEYDVPALEEFCHRLEKVQAKYPWIASQKVSD